MKMRYTIMLFLIYSTFSIVAMDEQTPKAIVVKPRKSKLTQSSEIELSKPIESATKKKKQSRATASSSQPTATDYAAQVAQIQSGINKAVSEFDSIETTLGEILLPLKPQLDAIKAVVDGLGAGADTMAPILIILINKTKGLETVITAMQSDFSTMKKDIAPLMKAFATRIAAIETQIAGEVTKVDQKCTGCLCAKKPKATTSTASTAEVQSSVRSANKK